MVEYAACALRAIFERAGRGAIILKYKYKYEYRNSL